MKHRRRSKHGRQRARFLPQIKRTALFGFLRRPHVQVGAAVLAMGLAFGAFWGGLPGQPVEPGTEPKASPSREVTVLVFCPDSGKTLSLDLEEYVAGVVAGEMPASFESEALKAQAVAARTYALSKSDAFAASGWGPDAHPKTPLCSSTHCQVYRTEAELRALKTDAWMTDSWPKIQAAVRATEGQVMYYQGQLVTQPLFHSSSGERTENSEDVFVASVPYLRSVSSDYEADAPHRSEEASFTFRQLESLLSASSACGALNKNNIRILSRSQGGRVLTFRAGSGEYTGREIRDLLGLYSADFTLSFQGDNVIFTSQGYGHGVGMSQWGANGMAQAGKSYSDILTHYYSGVSISVY